jgi:CheY-like chemotaxis protein/nitrogen-specific signal transduction histidine kinase
MDHGTIDEHPLPADAGPEAAARIARLEADLDAALRAARSRTDLLAAVSHEMRNHLSGILGMNQAVLETRITPEQRSYLNVAAATGDTLLTLVNDLLDVSRIEMGKLTLQEAPFNLRSTLGNVVTSFRRRAADKDLTLDLSVDADVPGWLVSDPGRFRQIVVNLVGNALKFTDVGGVRVTAGADDGGPDRVLLHVSVEDTGPGISPDDLEAIFRPYVQAGDGRSRGGTGLGLSIVANLVDLMGGRLFVESEVGKGSRFGVALPMVRYDEVVAAGTPDTTTGYEGLPVLVVSDGRQHRDALVGVLQSAGFRPEMTDDEEDALTVLRESALRDRPFAVTVCDLSTGSFNMAERIREDSTFNAMHVIVLTHVGQRGDAARCRELNTAGYLTRPLPAEDVLAAVRAVLGGPSPMDLSSLVTRHWLRERRHHLHLLVVDDSPTNRVVMRRLLETRGHSVTLASSGQEAVAHVGDHRFDLVFMDLDMPGFDGIQATRAIRAVEAGSRLPIVGLTSQRIEEFHDQATMAGMDTLVSKPFQVHEISTALEQLVIQAPRT